MFTAPRWSPVAYRRLVHASGTYDLLVTAPFATPWSLGLVLLPLSALNQQLGGQALPDFQPFHSLFACLMGSLVLVWSWLRVRQPEARFGRYDGIARLAFSSWMAWAWWQTKAPLIWLFLLPELVWALLQLWPTQRPRLAS